MATVRQHSILPAPRLTLTIGAAESFVDDVGSLGRSVRPRGAKPGRTHAEREDYCLRRWLVAMQSVGRLELPVTIEAYEDSGSSQPDFILTWPKSGRKHALEVTDATSQEYQASLTKTSNSGDEAQLLSGDGYAGSEPEHGLLKEIGEAIGRKQANLQSGQYGDVGAVELLIYVNSEYEIVADREKVFARLRDKAHLPPNSFRDIHVIYGDRVLVGLLGNRADEVDVSIMHAEDWVGWLTDQAGHLRKGEFEKVERVGLAEELESLARRDRRALASQVRRIIAHLLKLHYQSSRQDSLRSWKGSVGQARDEVDELLAESPSLMNQLSLILETEYPRARREAANETGIDFEVFPENCPFEIEQILDHEYWPKAEGDAP